MSYKVMKTMHRVSTIAETPLQIKDIMFYSPHPPPFPFPCRPLLKFLCHLISDEPQLDLMMNPRWISDEPQQRPDS
jgi:hypothetical protein